MKTVWIGAFAVALFGLSGTGWSLPAAPVAGPVVAGPSPELQLVRRHRHRGHGRHSRSRWSDREPVEAMPSPMMDPPHGSGTSTSDPPAASVLPRATNPEPPASTPHRPRRGSGSPPAIRWVDPEKPAR
jgi:hypothetical protein